jgi:hypothetical protein
MTRVLGYRALAAAPLVLAALSIAVVAMTPAGARDSVVQGEIDVAKALAGLGLLSAALAFDRGDYLRRGWGLWAATYLLLLGRDAMLMTHGTVSPAIYDGVRSVLVTLGNGCVIGGAWTLARAWKVAGMEYPGSAWSRRVGVGVAFVLSVVFAGPGFLADLQDLAHGRLVGVGYVASDLGDILSLPLIAPMALTALAVRDGTLRWPWMLLTAELVAWLVYDAVYAMPGYFHVSEAGADMVAEQLHVLAGLFACAAGLAQRKAVTDDDEGEASTIT